MSFLPAPLRLFALACASACFASQLEAAPPATAASDVWLLDSGTVQVGIDRLKGGAISWLSSSVHPSNLVNIHDPGRFIQQSYYAGLRLDRADEGQSPAWSPWRWNPIQCGSFASWARVTQIQRLKDGVLFTASVPKLWDMRDEEASATMQQWTYFEPGMPHVIAVRCRFESNRDELDRWGPALRLPQEVPACYFVRHLDRVFSYLGHGMWRAEAEQPGPPWSHCNPPRRTLALLDEHGFGVAIFSTGATGRWSYGPHGPGNSDLSTDNTCMHISPLALATLGAHSTYEYRYWLIVGTQDEIAKAADVLWAKYHTAQPTLSDR